MRAILTSIDEAVVILLVSFGAISLALEVNGGDALGMPCAVIMERDILQRADRGME